MICPKCKGFVDTANGPHHCAYVMRAEPAQYTLRGQPVGLVVEGPPDSTDGRRVDSRPASGGRAFSHTNDTGSFEVELSGVLERGRANERHALGVLVESFRAIGRDALLTSDGRDDRGEDGVLVVDGERLCVQVVTVPVDPMVWKALSVTGQKVICGTTDDAVAMLRQAFEHKRGKAVGVMLVLDAAHFGAFVGPRLAASYNLRHGDPEQEFSLAEAWLVGPTSHSVFRLGSR